MAMRTFFTAMWRTVMVRGLASLAFGVLAFVYPNITLSIVVTIFGIYALADGLVGLWGMYRGKVEGKTVPSLMVAIASVAAGLFCLLSPAVATVYVVLLIGLWNIAAGVLQVMGAMVLRKDIDNWGWMALSGLAGVALGILIIFYPANAAFSIIWIIAGTAVLVGLVLIIFGWKLRSAAERLLAA